MSQLQSRFSGVPVGALPLTTKAIFPESQETSWYAIQTRSRHEKKVATQLEDKQICSFLPLVQEMHNWSDRRKLIREALFPGYVFVRIPNSNEARIPVLRTAGVVGFVGVERAGTPIPDIEIESVQRLLSSEVQFGPFPFLRLGQRVRIRGGCLDGIEGVLTAKNSDQSVVVSIELIQRSLAVRVAGFDLEML